LSAAFHYIQLHERVRQPPQVRRQLPPLLRLIPLLLVMLVQAILMLLQLRHDRLEGFATSLRLAQAHSKPQPLQPAERAKRRAEGERRGVPVKPQLRELWQAADGIVGQPARRDSCSDRSDVKLNSVGSTARSMPSQYAL